MHGTRIEDVEAGQSIPPIRSPGGSTDPCPFPCAPANFGLCPGPLRTRPDDSHMCELTKSSTEASGRDRERERERERESEIETECLSVYLSVCLSVSLSVKGGIVCAIFRPWHISTQHRSARNEPGCRARPTSEEARLLGSEIGSLGPRAPLPRRVYLYTGLTMCNYVLLYTHRAIYLYACLYVYTVLTIYAHMYT